MLLTHTHTHTHLIVHSLSVYIIKHPCSLLAIVHISELYSPSPIGTQWNNHDNFAFAYHLSSGRMKGLHKLWVPLWSRATIWCTNLHCVFCPRPADGPPIDSNWTSTCRVPAWPESLLSAARRGRAASRRAAVAIPHLQQGKDYKQGKGGKEFSSCSFSFETEVLSGRWRSILGSDETNIQKVGVA